MNATINAECGLVPAVSAATAVVVRRVATYTCNTGYSLTGSPDNVTCINGSWIGQTPECNILKSSISLNSSPNIFNQLQEMPLWMMIILGIVGGLAALLLVCCMCALCLKYIIGYRPTACRRSEGDSYPGTCCCCCMPKIRQTNLDASQAESNAPKEDKYTKLTNHGIVTRKKDSTVSLPPTYVTVEKKRKLAKELQTWMPHSHEVRPYNTSTK